MVDRRRWIVFSGFMLAAVSVVASVALAATQDQVVDGVAIYFGIVPSGIVWGHPREHPESEMHGGVPPGESHLMVALFDDKTGKRIENATVTARVTGDRGLDLQKPLEAMVVGGKLTYGNYFKLLGAGPYRIEIRIKHPGAAREIRARFDWSRT